MDKFTYINNANGAFIEELYKQYLNNPDSVDNQWKKFFEGYEFASQNGVKATGSVVSSFTGDQKEASVAKLIAAYRDRGHLIAKTNPIRERRQHRADLNLDYFHLSDSDLNQEFELAKDIGLSGKKSLSAILTHLQNTYCSSIGVEYRHISNTELRQFMYKTIEPNGNRSQFTAQEKTHILHKLNQSVSFENFLHTKFVGQKRFSLEGIEAFIPGVDAMIEHGADLGIDEFVIGMAHRGRLNVLVNIFGKAYENIFSEFAGITMPSEKFGDGDVKYHLGRSADIKTQKGKELHLSLTPNPSHLEAVNPVVSGIVRAKAEKLYQKEFKKICPIMVHGDAAFAGQGVNYEVANFAYLDAYTTGGTIHVVLNNQVGFTANYTESRSSVYCTDIARVLEAPVFHVNADDPEAVVHVMRLAIMIRQQFGIDVFIDILGYRRYGHNEGDEPRFTQPKLYSLIDKHPNVYKIYLQKLIEEQTIDEATAKDRDNQLKALMQEKLDLSKAEKKAVEIDLLRRNWTGFRLSEDADFEESPETAYDKKDLDAVAKALTTIPDNFNLYSKMKKLLEQRKDMYFEKNTVDWGMAELLAYGSLLIDGYKIRMTGQDSKRGTFTHRHAVIKDELTENEYVPLNHIKKSQESFEVYNSLLSEYAVLGFEYGYSLALPKSLVIWEAQFGDFANGAQIVFDQFISASESKWQRMSGITVFLPHGFEGQGPEHSSGRVERFLTLCGQNNMYVCNVTEPANFFHLMRRQMLLPFRKPLILMTPKSLLRHPKVISPLSALQNGKFKEILDDQSVSSKQVKRVVFCSGKIYYDLLDYKEKNKIKDIAIIRLEQLYPLSQNALKQISQKYKHVKEWVWTQEEPENMGPWAFIKRKITTIDFRCIARRESSSPATGSPSKHQEEQERIVKETMTIA